MKLPLLVLLPVFLTACAMPEPRRDDTRDRIVGELRDALRDPRAQEATEKALLPPIAVATPLQKEVEPRFDLSVVNAPAQQVFMAIVNGTRYSMLMMPDVSGSVTLNLKDVTVKEALDSIRDLFGYEYRIQGTRITIQPNTIQSRVFQVNYLAAIRAGETELRVSSSAITSSGSTTNPNTPGGTPQPTTTPTGTPGSPATTNAPHLTTRVRTTSSHDFWGSLNTALTAIVGNAEGRSVVVNPVSGVVLVRALPREIRAVEQYLLAIQAIADRQVMLEAKIIEVTLNDSFQAGVNWASFSGSHNRSTIGTLQPNTTLQPSTGGNGNPMTGPDGASFIPGVAGAVATAATGGFFGLALQTANFAALINFLESQGSVSVLSSPRVATLNNQKAVLKVGTDELYVTNVTTNSTTTASGTTLSPTVTLQPYFSGISLDVTPQIDAEDNIVLHIHPAVTTVTEKEKLIDLGQQGIFKLPLAASTVNETDSIVRARDGYIVAIGGLMSQSSQIDRSGLPGTLGSDAGSLLGQRGRSSKKRELVILLKPTLVRDEKAWQQDIESALQRVEKLGR